MKFNGDDLLFPTEASTVVAAAPKLKIVSSTKSKRIEHVGVFDVFASGFFREIRSYDDLTTAIIAYGESKSTDTTTNAYTDAVGAALEIFSEFFFGRFGQKSNPKLGVLDIQHTSNNKFQVGYDYRFTNFKKGSGRIQVKFRRNEIHKFTQSELGTFVSACDMEDVVKEDRILFTNQDHLKTDNNPNGIFHFSYAGWRQMRVLDRRAQEEYIDRDSSFWPEFVAAIESSGSKSPVKFVVQRVLREHQERMIDSSLNDLPRLQVICATGGGKTEVQYRTVKHAFANGAQLCIVIAPVIDLVVQHHNYYQQFGLFHNEGVSALHFRTGDSCSPDSFIDYYQTTDESIIEAIKVRIENKKKIVLFTTYASEQNLFDMFRENEIMADWCIWDEFQYAVQQDNNYKQHLLTIPATFNRFYSASRKRGRIISATDESVFGPVAIDVSYAELRNKGILVPRIVIKLVRVKAKNLRGIERDLKKAAEREDFNIQDALLEAAVMIVARADMMNSTGRCNMLTFSQRVAICKALIKSEAVRAEMPGCELHAVYAAVARTDREKAYEEAKVSDDSVICQHSVLGVGVDITAFNCSVVFRNMEQIRTQQGPVGRIVRADAEDTKNLQDGKISLDSPEGWNKYTATIYVPVTDGDMADFEGFLKELVQKLQFSGLTEDDYQFAEIMEKYKGGAVKGEGDDEIGIEFDRAILTEQHIRELINKIVIDQEQMDRFEELDRLCEEQGIEF